MSAKIQLLLHYLNYIHENLDDKLVTEITVAEMEDYLLYLGNCGLEPNSISTKMNGLSIFYKYLINKGVTMFNPIYYIPKPHKLKTEEHRHFLTEEHIEILKEKLEENGDRTLQVYAFFSLSTAARVTAVSSIRWEQIDFEKRMVYKVKEKFSNYCTLLFSDYVKELLLKLRAEREANKINDGGWVFPSPTKFYKDNCVEIRHIGSNALGSWAHKVGAMCGVPELTPHDFRYSACNMLLQKRWRYCDCRNEGKGCRKSSGEACGKGKGQGRNIIIFRMGQSENGCPFLLLAAISSRKEVNMADNNANTTRTTEQQRVKEITDKLEEGLKELFESEIS